MWKKMTIITNPLASLVKKGLILGGFNAQKKNKLEEPLVDNVINEKCLGKDEAKIPSVDVEGCKSTRHYYVLHSRAKKVSSTTTLCVFLTAILVISLGILGGVYLYRQIARSSVHRIACSLPYPFEFQSGKAQKYRRLPNNGDRKFPSYALSSGPLSEAFFKVEYEIDNNRHYEKIEVPDMGKGRKGMFINDFAMNKTGIVDFYRRRCFVMKLDRKFVLPPRRLVDFARKVQLRTYDVDTRVIRKIMRVSLPPVKDYYSVGIFISRECRDMPIYPLQRVPVSEMVKRSIEDEEDSLRFLEPAGVGFLAIEIKNADSLE